MNSNSSDILKDRTPSKDLLWWSENIDHKVTPEARRVLEEYSNVPSDDVLAHVYAVREKAWERRPWPCTGLGSFLSPMISHIPIYPTILERVKSGAKLVDVGCYCGTDLRRLAQDGCPSGNLYGIDLVNHWDLGFELFRDQHKFSAKFYEGDILNPSPQMLCLRGNVDIISATHFLHNWDWETQVKACETLAILSKPGSLVVGYQIGTRDPGRAKWDEEKDKAGLVLHTPDTFKRLLEEVGVKTETQWEVDAVVRDWAELGHNEEETVYLGEDAGFLEFVGTRVQ